MSSVVETTCGWPARRHERQTDMLFDKHASCCLRLDQYMNVVALASQVVAGGGGIALSLHGIPGGGPALQVLLSNLLQVQDQQAEAIGRIDKNVERLIRGPWETAWLYMAEAVLPGRNADQIGDALAAAASKLRDAVPLQEKRTFGRAYACLDLAFVLRMRNDEAGGTSYATQAVEAATHFIHDVMAGRRKPPGYRRGDVALAWTREVGARGVTFGIAGSDAIEDVDGRINEWLVEIYAEYSAIYEAATLLIGKESAVVHLKDSLPKQLVSTRGRIRPKEEGRKLSERVQVGLRSLSERARVPKEEVEKLSERVKSSLRRKDS